MAEGEEGRINQGGGKAWRLLGVREGEASCNRDW
jgi:hypothetical protein